MDERQRKAFDFAQETVKQLISLSTGVLAITVTFVKDVTGGATDARVPLAWAWGLFALSIVLGLAGLMALTGSLASAAEPTPSVMGINVRIPVVLQILTFVLAVVLTVVAGARSL